MSTDERKTLLLAKLAELYRKEHEGDSSEEIHMAADHALLAYIGDAEVSAAFERLRRWYS
jgi:hypothetical protein